MLMKITHNHLTSLTFLFRFCRIDLFPLFRPSLPTFHYSLRAVGLIYEPEAIIPCGLPGEWPQKIL
jgi:hypothetical protein